MLLPGYCHQRLSIIPHSLLLPSSYFHKPIDLNFFFLFSLFNRTVIIKTIGPLSLPFPPLISIFKLNLKTISSKKDDLKLKLRLLVVN